ncbi:hypothetical protein ABUL39_13140 [Rhodothermus marinus]|jgi:hypothetical protein|uniref:hypothetical protein n=1 Tax=Rhodothermus marinus TaxID=29549 RepID=UPI0037C7408D
MFKNICSIFLTSLISWIYPFTSLGQSIEDVIVWVDSLKLEETEETLTGIIDVSLDPEGGFLVADVQEHQVRLYTQEGRLRLYFGGPGEAPGRLRNPRAPVRLLSGEILVPDFGGHLSLFDPRGKFIRRYTRVVVAGTYAVRDVPGPEVLVIGMRKVQRSAQPLLHFFDPEKGKITKSFFPHPISLDQYGGVIHSLSQSVDADVLGNRIVATFLLLNRLYFFDLNGRFIEEIEVPLRHFRRTIPEKPIASLEAFTQFLESHSLLARVFWLNRKIILILYQDLLDVQRRKARWSLAGVTPKGSVLFEVTDVPRLLVVNPRTGTLFFTHPNYETENYWLVGRLKPHVLRAAGLRP